MVRFVGKTSQLVAVDLHVIEVQSGRYNERRRKKKKKKKEEEEREREKKKGQQQI